MVIVLTGLMFIVWLGVSFAIVSMAGEMMRDGAPGIAMLTLLGIIWLFLAWFTLNLPSQIRADAAWRKNCVDTGGEIIVIDTSYTWVSTGRGGGYMMPVDEYGCLYPDGAVVAQ